MNTQNFCFVLKQNSHLLREGCFGLEKENVRVNQDGTLALDRKSTRLNSSHSV